MCLSSGASLPSPSLSSFYFFHLLQRSHPKAELQSGPCLQRFLWVLSLLGARKMQLLSSDLTKPLCAVSLFSPLEASELKLQSFPCSKVSWTQRIKLRCTEHQVCTVLNFGRIIFKVTWHFQNSFLPFKTTNMGSEQPGFKYQLYHLLELCDLKQVTWLL